MDGKSVEKLRMDRRLIGRRGWIAPEELEAELAQIPDAAHKVWEAPPEESSGEGDESPSPSSSAPD